MEKVYVELERRTITHAPSAYIYDAALIKASEKRCYEENCKALKNLFLIGDSVFYYDCRSIPDTLFSLSDNQKVAETSMNIIREKIKWIFENDTSFDYTNDSLGKEKFPLAKYNKERPDFQRSYPKSHLEMEFMKFFEFIGSLKENTLDRFNVLNHIEKQYLPLRTL